MTQKTTTADIPRHLAVICDGNRRWARTHGLEVFRGHQYATDKVFEPLIEAAIKEGIEYLTFWVFSTENWQRPEQEVDFLLGLLRSFFDKQVERLSEQGIRLQMIGDKSSFDQDIQQKIDWAIEQTKDNSRIQVTLAMNYGGHDEIVRAARNLATKVESGEIGPSQIDAKLISAELDTGRIGLPDPDLIVRTGGEQRLSGFMSWQTEYSEFIFADWYFPEFGPEKLREVLAEYASRQRRFGK